MASIEGKIKEVKETIAQASKLVDALDLHKPDTQELKSAANMVARATADLNRLVGITIANATRR